MKADLNTRLRFRIQSDITLIGSGNALLRVGGDGTIDRMAVEQYRASLPVFDSTQHATFWIQGGQLFQSGEVSSKYIGDVLSGQTVFWAGEKLGFGLYQASEITRAFTFSPGHRGIRDDIDLGPISGQIVDASCALSETHVWFLMRTEEAGRLLHRVYVIEHGGSVVATADAEAGSDTWLGHGIRGHLAVGKSLFVATDDGIIRLVAESGSIQVEREFPDTEPFVSAGDTLLPGRNGITVVSQRKITHLEIR